jgi:hypothetical protein
MNMDCLLNLTLPEAMAVQNALGCAIHEKNGNPQEIAAMKRVYVKLELYVEGQMPKLQPIEQRGFKGML